MSGPEFEWDDANIGHIDLHGVEPEESEEALSDPGRIAATAYRVGTERRRAVIGMTLAERLLFVVFTIRGGRVRVITARDADVHEQRAYREKQRR